MGDPRRLKKKFKSPNHPWEKERMMDELKYIGRYGLRNKRELWRHESQLRRFRQIARNLRTESQARQEKGTREVTGRLYRLGITPKEIGLEDILALSVEEILNRRLQSVVFKKGLARTTHHARQLIAHGHIAVNGRKINSPSYLVKRAEEQTVNFYELSPYSNPDHVGRGDNIINEAGGD